MAAAEIYTAGAPGAQLAALLGANDVVELGRHPDRRLRCNNQTPTILTVSGRLARDRPDIVARYLGRLLQASAWAGDHRSETARIVANDVGATEEWVHAAYGEDWHDGILTKLLAESGSASLDDWLREMFFEEHCKLFHHRPFIWHIWDGRKRDGFHALVNYHKLAEGDGKGRRLLESLTYSYLGDWISRQQDGVKRGEGGAEDRLAAAMELQKRLVAILGGEPPFDLFVRWKPIEEQSIGWEPDINDGVRLNIRPFMAQDLPCGKKGSGVLRAKPNIHWKKDGGKEPTRDQGQFPWFWENGTFTDKRVNDVHLANAEKRAALEAVGSAETRK